MSSARQTADIGVVASVICEIGIDPLANREVARGAEVENVTNEPSDGEVARIAQTIVGIEGESEITGEAGLDNVDGNGPQTVECKVWGAEGGRETQSKRHRSKTARTGG
jgi:hypothetical protein